MTKAVFRGVGVLRTKANIDDQPYLFLMPLTLADSNNFLFLYNFTTFCTCCAPFSCKIWTK